MRVHGVNSNLERELPPFVLLFDVAGVTERARESRADIPQDPEMRTLDDVGSLNVSLGAAPNASRPVECDDGVMKLARLVGEPVRSR